MIGIASFFIEMLGIVIPTVILLGSLLFSWRTGRSNRAFIRIWQVGMCSVFLFIMGTRFFNQVQSRNFLKSLDATKVAEIEIGRKRISDPAKIKIIVSALNQADWFSMNHGGTAEEVHLGVIPRNGEHRDFRVAYYMREPGAVISFTRENWHDGYAFCPALPKALIESGAPLPEKEQTEKE